ncbi:MAG: SGNH/GDSL hydrolase family protein [Cypionkella sp.]|nr:SGNH/GDSL hydrolase family protein [Cypionkella sp.]
MQRWTTALSAAMIECAFAFQDAKAEVKGSPDILVLGDSQLSFGAGVAFVELFGAMRGKCGLDQDATVGVIGVRSSTLQSWTSTGRSAKSAICDVDPKWKVNAGVYGTLSQGENPYVQIGRGEQFQFCSPDRSPLEAVFHGGYYQPKLVLMFLMGNATDRWADSPEAAVQDVRSFWHDLPTGQPCIFMTSAPPYGRKADPPAPEGAGQHRGGFCQGGSAVQLCPRVHGTNRGRKQRQRGELPAQGLGQGQGPLSPDRSRRAQVHGAAAGCAVPGGCRSACAVEPGRSRPRDIG